MAAVGKGVAAATTASTVAAGAFIGSATALGMAAATAAVTSHNAQEFADQGGPALMSTATGAVLGGASGYDIAKGSSSTTKAPTASKPKPKPASTPKAAPKSTPARYTPDQDALIQLAKENRRGISMSDAKILESWGSEYNVRAEIHMGHPNRPSSVSQNPHFHFGNGSDHVPIFPD